jgi:hypothetical protein
MVRVRDHAGQPVRAEVTLWAADEGVLMLTGYRTTDPFAPVYARHELDVSTRPTCSGGLSTTRSCGRKGAGTAAAKGPRSARAFLSTAFLLAGGRDRRARRGHRGLRAPRQRDPLAGHGGWPRTLASASAAASRR